ncbi:unnamed protein product [Spirodela intermedia]|uniref:C2H2-type domain-containing protein n=1 Tax=Spirodela intermedia TaxID=51605 RepID=A0A7I8IUU8_SPIIN|nr:unnamed protein product [Spirodela intermedia]CAA6661775.1 unnamed protein product [Spirodela intermedia]
MKRLRTGREGEVESINLANVLVLLSRSNDGGGGAAAFEAANHGQSRVFECKTCNRRFPSFQALGGHRASHKKPRLGGEQHGQAASPVPVAVPGKPRVHECSICGLEFSIGQALGGHMRRHRAAPTASGRRHRRRRATGEPAVVGEKRTELGLALELDLNLPPSNSEADFRSLSLGLGFPWLTASIDACKILTSSFRYKKL